MLKEYLIANRWIERKKNLRLKILKLLNTGAAIELGPMRASVRDAQRQQLSSKSLTPLMGEQWVAQMRSRIEPIDVQHLYVHRESW
jgi:hypothetical protein